MPLRLYIDAMTHGNPGPSAVGVVVRSADDQPIRQMGRFIGDRNDLEAAVQSLLMGLEAAVEIDKTEVAVYSSSSWLVRQLTGQGRDPGERLAMLLAQAQMLLLRFDTWRISHVSPDENGLASDLADHSATVRRDVESPRVEAASTRSRKEVSSLAVRVVQSSNPRTCAEPCGAGEVFEFADVAPAHMCLDAMAAVLDIVMACRRGDPDTLKKLPLRRKCARPGCGAVFEVHSR